MDDADGPGVTARRESLPGVVRRWLDRALVSTPPLDAAWQVEQQGELQFRPGRWAPWSGVQTYSVDRPAFSWRVTLSVIPHLLWLRIDDGCDGDEGWGRARVWGLLKSIDEHGPHLYRTQVSRYLTDLAFAPHAALANDRLTWHEDGEDAALVRIAAGERLDGDAEARLVFGEDGDLVGASVPDRPRNVPGRDALEDTPFRVAYGRHVDVGGIRMPTRAEAGFEPDGVPQPLMRIRVTGARSLPSEV